jgi:FAD/FMN-containing dehydrogenase
MRPVEVNAATEIATIAGGATGADVGATTTRLGPAAVTANVGAVGMAGFLLAGGYGGLTTRFGLAVDNLLEAQFVLADGRVVWTNASHNEDLFGTIRGGGGNFGVVTSMSIRLRPIKEVLAGDWINLTPDAISALVAGGSASTSPHSFIAFHHFHGPGAQVASDAAAFHLRRNFMIEIGAAWEGGTEADADRHRLWACDLFSSLGPYSLPGGYANFLTSDDQDQIAVAYGRNAGRLRKLKQVRP